MVHRHRVFVSAVTAFVATGLVANTAARAEDGATTCPHQATSSRATPLPAPAARTNTYRGTSKTTVYLERHGGVLRPGYDDASAGHSALVYGAGLSSLDVPAYGGNEREWQGVLSCVQRGLSAYAVDVVGQRPAAGGYSMIMIGGKASMLGYGGGVSGVAPYSGELMQGAIGFVFSAAVREDADQVCQSALHEIGHTLGLDHAYECSDVMSYLYGCGEKTFTDVDASCGEHATRECANGEARQNSHRRLLANVGARAPVVGDGSVGPERGEREARTESKDGDWGGWGGEEPAVEVMGVEIESGVDSRRVYIAAWVGGGGRVELAWATEEQAYLFDCDQMPEGVPASCEREGELAIFTLLVGAGERMFAVRVTNQQGEAMTTPRRL